MKNLIISALVLTVAVVFAGCRGSNSTYTTTPTSGYTEASTNGSQSETPTINNGNGPITTAATDSSMDDTSEEGGAGIMPNGQTNGGTGSSNANSSSNTGTSGNGSTSTGNETAGKSSGTASKNGSNTNSTGKAAGKGMGSN